MEAPFQAAFPKIKAIKEVREKTQCGLKEAKDAVEDAMLYSDDFDTVVQSAINYFSSADKLLNYALLYNRLRGCVLNDDILLEDINGPSLIRSIEEDERERVNAEIQKHRAIFKDDLEDAVSAAEKVLSAMEINAILRSFCK